MENSYQYLDIPTRTAKGYFFFQLLRNRDKMPYIDKASHFVECKTFEEVMVAVA